MFAWCKEATQYQGLLSALFSSSISSVFSTLFQQFSEHALILLILKSVVYLSERKSKSALTKQGSSKGGQSSNYLDKTGGTSLEKLIKMALNLGSGLPLEMKAHFLFRLLRFFFFFFQIKSEEAFPDAE